MRRMIAHIFLVAILIFPPTPISADKDSAPPLESEEVVMESKGITSGDNTKKEKAKNQSDPDKTGLKSQATEDPNSSTTDPNVATTEHDAKAPGPGNEIENAEKAKVDTEATPSTTPSKTAFEAALLSAVIKTKSKIPDETRTSEPKNMKTNNTSTTELVQSAEISAFAQTSDTDTNTAKQKDTIQIPKSEQPDERTTPESKAHETTPDIIISEFQIKGEKADDDFVELYNTSDDTIDLDGFQLRRKTKGDDSEKGKLFHKFNTGDSIPSGKFFLWANKDGEAGFIDIADTVSDNKSSPALTDNNSLALFDKEGSTLDSATWGSDHKSPFSPTIGDNPGKSESYARNLDDHTWSIIQNPTPTNSEGKTTGEENDPDPGSDPEIPPTHIIISEIRIEGDSSKDEFVELYNAGDEPVNLSDLELIRKYVSTRTVGGIKERYGKEASVTKSFPDFELKPESFFIWANKNGKYAEPFADAETGYSLTENNALALRKKGGTILDSVSWGSDSELTKFGATYPNVRNPGKDSLVQDPVTHTWALSDRPTPTNSRGKMMLDPEPVIAPFPPDGSIRINEVFANPETRGEADEWIELANTSSADISLAGFILRDASKYGKYVLGDAVAIGAGSFLVLPRNNTKISLNNGSETVTLLHGDDKTVITTLSYDRTVEGASYGYYKDGRYRFSEKDTPGKKNRFGKEPKIEDYDIPKRGYRDVPVAFSAEGSEDDMRYVWNFGNEHRSYKQQTTHRYEKTGTYRGSVTVRGDIEEVVKYFTIRIEKYPKHDLRIVALLPNPDGRDTDFEWIRIENREKKTVDLTGWIIASGTTEKKLVNHRILTEDLSIGGGESLILTRADSRFTLPNKRAVIELRRPDGSRADRITYDRPDGIDEEELLMIAEDGSLVWVAPAPEADTSTTSVSRSSEEPDNPFLRGMTAQPAPFTFASFLTFGTPFRLVLPDTAPRVLGLSDDRMNTNLRNTGEKVSVLDTVFQALNSTIESLLRQ